MIYVTTAAVENTSGSATGPFIRLDVNSNGGCGGTGCNGPTSLTPNTGGNPAPIQLTSNTFQELQFIFPQLGAQSTLEVTGFPANNGGTKTVRIRKIRIVETPPAASFTITPNPISATCGDNNPLTLTINNNGNTPGITNYSWNIGTTPNGWLLNGNPAPAVYSSGTVNTLTLTPVCGSSLSNITGTVTAGGNTYQTNTATVSISIPSLSITGNSSICSGSSTYSIANLPCNATVNWSVSPSGIALPSCTACSSTILTKNGTGNITLTANVSLCGSVYTITKSVLIGTPSPTGMFFQIIDPTFGKIRAVASAVPGATSYNWYINGVMGTTGGHGVGYTFGGLSNCDVYYDISVAAITACGTSAQYHQNAYMPCQNNFMISPNPASGNVTVSADQSKSAKQVNSTVDEIRIYDMQGNLKNSKNFNKVKSASVDISNLPTGTYFIEITSGTYKERKQLQIQK